MRDPVQVINVGLDRFCLIDGQMYVSVTSLFNILEKHELKEWRKQVGEERADRIANEAGAFGKAVHLACEEVAKGIEVSSSDAKVRVAAQRFKAWMGRAVERVILIEKRVWSHPLRVAGQLDLLVVLKGDDCYSVADIKTGTPSPLVGLQLSGYRRLASESEGIPIERIRRRLVIPIRRETVAEAASIKVRELPEKDNQRDLEAFESLVNLWHWLRRTK